jgi:CrcB protein
MQQSSAKRMRIDRGELVAIFVGGCVGTLGRAGLAEAFPPRAGHWPWATFAVNIAGSFLLGYLVTSPPRRLARYEHPRALLGIGFCGALTTFSTMQLELLRMLDAGRVVMAAGYAAGSVAAGLLAVTVADGLARHARTVVR